MGKIKDLKSIYFVLFFTLLIYIVFFLFDFIEEIFQIQDINFTDRCPNSGSPISYFIKGVIIAPIFETFLFQMLVYNIFSKFFSLKLKQNQYILIFVGALLFGVGHWYSLLYMLSTFLGGAILMYAYMLKAENKKESFILVAIIHSLHNLYTFVYNTFLL